MRLALAAFSLLAFSITAHAEAEPCPEDAEQRLYEMVESIGRGAQSDAAPVATLAEWAVATCQARTHVQALAATLLGAVIQATPDRQKLAHYVDLAERAISLNDSSWNPRIGPAVLKKSDGSSIDYFGYSQATGVLIDRVLPYGVALAEAGMPPRLLSGEPYSGCPYAAHSASRLADEARLWDKNVFMKSDQPLFVLAETRLQMLQASCPSHRRDLNFYLARLYGQEVEVLTGWGHHYSEDFQMRNGGWYWRHEMLRDLIFEEDEMLARKAEFDARARPLAEKAKPYLDALYKLPETLTAKDHEQLERANRWKKAVGASLAAD
ncbi:hypothetical protein HPO_14676 [Hyphomonas polymorpha PS728]|uniref:Lipoprotein n=1 Tax=Hyphomonas polymorpha PS728 TaxID=1280954 RepID=A0A062VFX8_9PROT|nr:hypothetical protein [Hyphomonas polymorpha]KCZ97433.1 hypothetical protein HPO_14676 [Hyphomonas polymorpha PS728]